MFPGSRLARLIFVAILVTPITTLASHPALPEEAPRVGVVISIDVSTNKAWLFRDGEVLAESRVATGSDKILRNGHRVWFFRTPRGRLSVVDKIVDPIWTKPDWAFIEEGKRVPPADSPSRRVRGTMGKYALDLGGGFLIHGTDDPKFPPAHGEALAREIPGASLLLLEGVGHEYPPARTWDVVIAALLEHTAR